MKKYFAVWAALLMLAMCVGAQAAGYTAGTYEGTAAGLNGDITVSVTVSSDAITAVEILAQQETVGIADAALEQIPERIVASQSLGVDSVSGATFTSKGIVDAVAAAVTLAGGDAQALREVPVEEVLSGETLELTADAVVVGGGAAGMAATVRLAQLGKSVILLEKSAYLGGAIAVSGGNQVVMGSKLQAEAGVTDDSVESMVEDFMKNGANLNVPELLELYAANVGAATDWLNEDCGIAFNMEDGLHQLGEYSHDRELAYVGGGAGFAESMRAAVDASGATVLLSTRAQSLNVTDGRVTGVTAQANEGTTYVITANDVLLATGGYGNSDTLLSDELASALYYGPASSTGDGVIMATAEGIDAATRLMEYGKRYPNGVEVSEGIAKSTIAGNIVGWTMSAILVNAEGERVVNEKASNRTILEAELEQTGSMLFLLMDAQTFDVWKTKLAAAGLTEETIDGYVANNGASAPVFAHGETLAEAAAAAGVDGAALEKTVERYNGFVAAGVDEDFGRAAAYMTMPIGDGPYYLVEQKPRFATTMGGLVVNTSLQVINTKDEVIGGLYAAGEVVGGVMGDDSPSGANNGWALTAGKLAAEAIAAQ
ncbi:MAG: FAD-dependent oxidoreductase [Candidatus Ventricola sp.]